MYIRWTIMRHESPRVIFIMRRVGIMGWKGGDGRIVGSISPHGGTLVKGRRLGTGATRGQWKDQGVSPGTESNVKRIRDIINRDIVLYIVLYVRNEAWAIIRSIVGAWNARVGW
jgi:hypothetical protein